jgi:hypothetical protein
MSDRQVLTLLGVAMELCSDDAGFTDEFVKIFGGRGDPPGSPVAAFTVSVEGASERPGFGRLRASGDDLEDPAAFLAGFASPTVPLRQVVAPEPGWTALALGDSEEPLFLFRGGDCYFRKVERWRRIVSHFLFLRILRQRPDALFFHAASVAIGGRGVLFVGPKGTGKSTASLALAARGHEFLGDETACYLPASGELLPFRRPAGIKPGPQSAAVAAALARLDPPADEEGLRRVPIEALVSVPPARPARLSAVVFMTGFGPGPVLSKIRAGREELAALQPIAAAAAGSVTRRVFEMVRLIGSLECYRLVAGDPDETARLLEKELGVPSASP